MHNHGLQVNISNLARRQAPSGTPNLLYHGLEWYHQSRSITASKFAQSLFPSASPTSVDYSLRVRMIMACKSISTLTQLHPPSSHEHHLQVHTSRPTQSGPPSASRISLDHGLQLYLQTGSILPSRCISTLAR